MKSKLVVCALVSSLVASPAFAWGSYEQGLLSGAAGLWLLQRFTQPQVGAYPPSYPVPQGPMVGQYPTGPLPYVLAPQCRQVLTLQYDRYGNEYRYPATVCN
jgi:hypothetical protein